MKKHKQTERKRRKAIVKDKTRLALSAPRKPYAHNMWDEGSKGKVGGEPVMRLRTLTSSRTEHFGFW